VGVNVGQAAGQTVMHAHIHLIPRHVGDVPDPRGGVRFVVPQKAKYFEQSFIREAGPENGNQ
jgi:diadenosine tetraphosphate (Ap4A) HIT family hydrolase